MSYLEKLRQKHDKPIPPALMLYGVDGVGKTSLMAQFPQSCIVAHPNEAGVSDLKSAGLIPDDYPFFLVETWEDLDGFVDELLAAEEPPFRLVTFDTANTTIQRLLREYILQRDFDGSEDKFNAWGGAGWKVVLPEFEHFLTKLTKLRTENAVAVCLLAHARRQQIKNPNGTDYLTFQPDLYEASSQNSRTSLLDAAKRWATDIGYLDFWVEVDDDTKKAKGGKARRVHFNTEAAFEAKNRKGITEPILLGDDPKEACAKLRAALKPGGSK